MEISPGIHFIDGIRVANCYLWTGGSKPVLIDTGMPGSAKRVLVYLNSAGIKPEDIKYILLTHSDIDHTGSAAALKQITGAKLAIHEMDEAVLAGKKPHKAITGPQGLVMNLLLKMMRSNPIEPDLLLKEGMEIEGLKIISTPGHTPGSISLYNPGRAIFVGDTIGTNSRGNPRPFTNNVTADIPRAWESVAAISKLDFEVMLPGHGSPITIKGSDKVREMFIKFRLQAVS